PGPGRARAGRGLLRLLLGGAGGHAGQAPPGPGRAGQRREPADRAEPGHGPRPGLPAVRSHARHRVPHGCHERRRTPRSTGRDPRRGAGEGLRLEPAGIEPTMAAGEPSITLAPPAEESARPQVWRAIWELVHDLSVAVLFCFFLITFVAQA